HHDEGGGGTDARYGARARARARGRRRALDGDGGRLPRHLRRRMRGRHLRIRRNLGAGRSARARGGGGDRRYIQDRSVMAFEPVRVGCVGMGWWSDVLADAMQRSGKLKIVACYSRMDTKRAAFAAKYGCEAVPTYRHILRNPDIEAVVNTTPNNVHLQTTRAAAEAGKHVFLDKPIANTIS